MLGRFIALLVLGSGCGLGPAAGQEDLNRGRTPAQLFASDCADCHRNPRALKRNDPATLTRFLRVHYTASRENASALAAYLISLGPDPRGSRSGSGQRRPAAQPQGQTAQPAAKPDETVAPTPAEADAEKPAAPPSAGSGETQAPATPEAAPASPQ